MQAPVRLLAPHVPLPLLRRITGLALAGAVVAGSYGILHDQLTYTLSPEYFTRLKFSQFAWAEFGLSPRLWVAEIGFLATWWVGFAGTWFFARVAASRHPAAALPGSVRRMWLVLLISAAAAGAIGFLAGPAYYLSDSAWNDAISALQLDHPRAFAQVAGIHLGGYLGALIGWLAAMLHTASSSRTGTW